MPCPHCNVSFHPVWQYGWIDEPQADHSCWQWTKTVCPACNNIVVKARLRTMFGGAAPGEEMYPVYKEIWIEPYSPKRIPVGDDVPSELREDYEESVAVLPISPKSSAALSRRVLQSMLKDQGYDRRNLADQIDLLLAENRSDKVLPTSVRANVDVIRNVGNFAAHAITDDTTLQVIPVIREEAEWCLTIVEALFEHFYVIPAANKKRLEEFTSKLAQAGQKPPKS